MPTLPHLRITTPRAVSVAGILVMIGCFAFFFHDAPQTAEDFQAPVKKQECIATNDEPGSNTDCPSE
ncbi:hypothetical protein [Nocardioides sp. GY 10127]|uniref:hypothetical protein n=1 Tax=Nocardioides sp. GY 10127 TaxID=2569762 RepID=UPI0010A8F70A|nr:hypothetical protein [Nocardioides sp. GY 10127]TIC80708.1 hypothetical protein E8D37_12515 [Nocardioides sp. GY 10127]